MGGDPTAFALIWAFPAWRRRLRRRDARYLLPLAWWLLIVVFFSIPSGKRDVYIMPALPMVALACAPYLPQIVERRWFRVLALAVLVALGAVFAGTGLHAWSGHWKFANDLAAQRGFDGGGVALWSLLIALGAWLHDGAVRAGSARDGTGPAGDQELRP